MVRLILVMLLIPSMLFGVAPVSDRIGRIDIAPEPGSLGERAIKAAGEEYTEAWLEEFAVDKISFGEAYSSLLSEILPLSSIVVGQVKDDAVSVMSLEDYSVLTFIFQDGRIAAVTPLP